MFGITEAEMLPYLSSVIPFIINYSFSKVWNFGKARLNTRLI